jgi:hydrogenase maturation protein HypF
MTNATLHSAPLAPSALQGRCMTVTGIVQGVGFRPKALQLAQAHGITGTVHNEGTAAVLMAYGASSALAGFERALRVMAGGGLRIDAVHVHETALPPQMPYAFEILSSVDAPPGLGVSPDWAACAACAAEVLDPFSRRFRYPLLACAECGPRLSVFVRPPYDRAHTTMAPFPLCAACEADYTDPNDRRFHAQAIACHVCGPKVKLSRLDGRAFALDALSFLDDTDAATSLMGKGEIVLIKGTGGYQLACDATNADAVMRLRALKQRDAKPFALMVRNLDMARQWCEVDAAAEAALSSAAAPIVLLPRLAAPDDGIRAIADDVAPGLSHLGVMLPPSPLHHLLMRRRRSPIVLTSGNVSGEPQATTLSDACKHVAGQVHYVLDHERHIERRVDDSVGRVIAGQFRVMRRARGYAPAPLPLPLGFDTHTRVLAMGGDLKNTFALLQGGQGVISQHMGDLHDATCLADQQQALSDYLRFYDFTPEVVACDAHPGYASGQMVPGRFACPVVSVGHHHAHIASCLGEHGWPLDGGRVLGIALDGLGMGEDGQLWGGEFLLADYQHAERVGTFKPVPLLGGDKAASEPWRNTYAHLMAEMGWPRFALNFDGLPLFAYLQDKPRALLEQIMHNPALAPKASSVGRLFDAVAAAIGLCRDGIAYEGEAAMRLEALITADDLAEDSELDYPFSIPRLNKGKGLPYVEPLAMWQALLGDLILQTPPARISARFHRGLAQVIVRMAVQLCEAHQVRTVALGGGVFQNKVLTERVLQGLHDAGLQALMPQHVPSNDGGLAWGQALIALARHTASATTTTPQRTAPCA